MQLRGWAGYVWSAWRAETVCHRLNGPGPISTERLWETMMPTAWLKLGPPGTWL